MKKKAEQAEDPAADGDLAVGQGMRRKKKADQAEDKADQAEDKADLVKDVWMMRILRTK